MITCPELRTRRVGPWGLNAYGLICPVTGQSVLVDPGAEPDSLVAMLADCIPVAILITHAHADHVGALSAVRSRLNVSVMAHPDGDARGLDICAERWLHHGDSVLFGACRLTVYHTPGHTPDKLQPAASHRPLGRVNRRVCRF